MRILVLGAGATGGFFGGRLAHAGADVTFLLRPQRAGQLAKSGLRIESPLGNLAVPVKTVTADQVRPDFDVVLLSCKAYDLDSAIDAIRPAVGAQTRIVPLLNGMKHLDDLDAEFGPERVLGGTCHISVTLSPDGIIRHLSPAHISLTLGSRNAAQTAFAAQLHSELSRGDIEARLSDDIVQVMWDKWVMLATMASMTCLMRANLGEIARTTYGAEVIAATFRECCSIADACGSPIKSDVVARNVALLTDRTSTLAASMLRDLEAGARIEADHIIGDLIFRADARAVPVPNLAAAYTALEVYQAHRAAVGSA